jgi:capsular polysaccharide transport system permease protein
MRLLAGLYAQLWVIQTLALRETRTRFGNHRLGYVWALLEPLVWIGTFWGMFHLAQKAPPTGMDMLTFLATASSRTTSSRSRRTAAPPPSTPTEACCSTPRCTRSTSSSRAPASSSPRTWWSSVIIGAHALLIGGYAVANPLMLLQGLVLASLLGTSLGLVFAALSVENNLVDRVRGPLMRPLFWTSGIFFTLNSLPLVAREVMLWNPVLHCVEFVRSGFFESYEGDHMSAATCCCGSSASASWASPWSAPSATRWRSRDPAHRGHQGVHDARRDARGAGPHHGHVSQ